MRIGVLAVQGAFIEHRHILESLGTETFEIRQLADLNEPMDGIIIPGGESTVIGKLLTDLGMMEPLKEKTISLFYMGELFHLVPGNVETCTMGAEHTSRRVVQVP